MTRCGDLVTLSGALLENFGQSAGVGSHIERGFAVPKMYTGLFDSLQRRSASSVIRARKTHLHRRDKVGKRERRIFLQQLCHPCGHPGVH